MRTLALLFGVLGSVGGAAAAAAPSTYEAALDHAVAAWFAGQDVGGAAAEAQAALGTATPAAAPLADLKTAADKLTADAARGIAGFATESLVDFTVAQAAADAAIARSALTRANAALAGQTVDPGAAAALAAMATRLDALLAELQGS